jgi:membrane protease YdiL (CAAX protease family)
MAAGTATRVWPVLIAPPVLLAVLVALVGWPLALARASTIDAVLPGALPFILAVNHSVVFLGLLRVLRREGLSLADIGWRWPRSGRAMAREVLIGLSFALVLIVLDRRVIRPLLGLPEAGSPVRLASGTEWAWLVVATVFPFVEESVYRGFAIPRLREHMGVTPAVLAASLAFGLLHWGLGLAGVLNAAVLGVLFSAVFLTRRDLIAVTVAHSGRNFAIVCGAFT